MCMCVCVGVCRVFYIVFTIRLMYFIHDWRINREHALSLIRLQSVLLVCSVYFFIQFFPSLKRQDCDIRVPKWADFFCNFIFLLSLNPLPLSTNKSGVSFFLPLSISYHRQISKHSTGHIARSFIHISIAPYFLQFSSLERKNEDQKIKKRNTA